mmetsp:Transcript_21936/g.32689  ORF Transcript_21936/g.32689 Transcript_21936/m.32689 type:complete len:296 (-) Transcript_21936:164-1051(-)
MDKKSLIFDFRGYAIEEAEQSYLFLSKVSKDSKEVIDDYTAENIVSSFECILLFGLKGRQASQGSFWKFIKDCAKHNQGEKVFCSDVSFASSLYFDDDANNIKRGRAWIRQLLNAQRAKQSFSVIAKSTDVIRRWTHVHSVLRSLRLTQRLLEIAKQVSKFKFELQLHYKCRYHWKIIDGYPTRVYDKAGIAQRTKRNKELIVQSTIKAMSEMEIGRERKTSQIDVSATTPWVRFIDEDSKHAYYFNARTGATTWTEPKEGYLTDASALAWQKTKRKPSNSVASDDTASTFASET